MLLAVSGMSVVACGNDDNTGFPTAKKDSGTPGDDDDDDDDDDASVTDAGTNKDATTGSDTGTGSNDAAPGQDSSTTGVTSADIYACGGPNDCPSGMNCYIQAYSNWDGGDFSASGCKLEGANGTSACKTSGLTSDVQACGELSDGGYSPCPSGYSCQTVDVHGKDFGACLSVPAYDAGCGSKSNAFIPYVDEANYCFSNPVNGSDGGCSGANPVCCDQTLTDGGFANSCVATAADCAQ